jgi:uncharacterized protein YoxC
MKRAWDGGRKKSRRSKKGPDHFTTLLTDVQVIKYRMQRRLGEYRHVGERVSELHEQMEENQEDADVLRFAKSVHGIDMQLRSMKASRLDESLETLEQIREAVAGAQAAQGPAAVVKLDRMAESVRDVANEQEDLLKKYREVVTKLSELSEAKRGDEQPEVRRSAEQIAMLCRSVLRNRDMEE